MSNLVVSSRQIRAALTAKRTPKPPRRKHLWVRGRLPLTLACSRRGCDVVWHPDQRATVHGSCTGTDRPTKETSNGRP